MVGRVAFDGGENLEGIFLGGPGGISGVDVYGVVVTEEEGDAWGRMFRG